MMLVLEYAALQVLGRLGMHLFLPARFRETASSRWKRN
jgi:hypothetical protein